MHSRRAFSVSSTTSDSSSVSSMASNNNNDNKRKFYHRFFKKINKSESYCVNQIPGLINTIGVRVEVESSCPTEFTLGHLLQSTSFQFSVHRDEPSFSLVNKAHTRMVQLLRSAIDDQRVAFHPGTAFFKHIFDTSVAQLWVKVKFSSRVDKSFSECWSYFFLEDFHTAMLDNGRRSSQTTPYDLQMLKWSQKRSTPVSEQSPAPGSCTPLYPSTAMGEPHIRHLLRNFCIPEFENQTRQQQTVLNLYAFLAPLFALEIVDLCFVLRYDSRTCDFGQQDIVIGGKDDDRASSVTSGCSSWVPSEEEENNKHSPTGDDIFDHPKKVDEENLSYSSATSSASASDSSASSSQPETETSTLACKSHSTGALKSAMQVLTFSNVRAMKRFRSKTRNPSTNQLTPQRPHSTIIESAADVVDGAEFGTPLKSFVSVDNLGPVGGNLNGLPGGKNFIFNQTRLGSALVTGSSGSLAFCRKIINKTRSVLSVDKLDSAVAAEQQQQQPSPIASSGRCSTSSVASSAHSSRLFGVDIGESVPVSILCLIKTFVLAQGLVAEGIFRKSANARNCRELRKLLEEYEESIAESCDLYDDSLQKLEEELIENIKHYTVYDMASTLKEFVRQLPSGALAPEREYDRLREIADQITKLSADPSETDRQDCIDSLRSLISENRNACLLPILLSVLYQVSCSEENVKTNLMCSNNLAVCIGASLISASLPPSISNTQLDAPKSTSNSKLLSISTTSIRDLFSSKANSHMHQSVSNLTTSPLPTSGLEPERISSLVTFLIENCNAILGADTSETIFKLINVEHDKNRECHDNYLNEELEDEVFFDDIIAEYGPRNSTVRASKANLNEDRSFSNLSDEIFEDYYEEDTINASDCTVRSLFRSNYEHFNKYCSAYEQRRSHMKDKIRKESKHPLIFASFDDDEDSDDKNSP